MTVKSFQTAQGSTYRVLPNGQTERTKRSPGQGQNTTYPPHNCVFVSAEAVAHLVGQPGVSYRLVTADATTGANMAFVGENVLNLSSGHAAGVLVYRRADRKVLMTIRGEVEPRIGFHPVEERFENDLHHTHVGNAIVRVD